MSQVARSTLFLCVDGGMYAELALSCPEQNNTVRVDIEVGEVRSLCNL
jgi:hypothetical protein